MKNDIKNKNFGFPTKLYKIEKMLEKNYWSKEDIQIYLRLFSNRTRSFRFNRKNAIKTEKFHFILNISEIWKKFGEENCSAFKDFFITRTWEGAFLIRAQRTKSSLFRSIFEEKFKMCPFNSVNITFSLYVCQRAFHARSHRYIMKISCVWKWGISSLLLLLRSPPFHVLVMKNIVFNTHLRLVPKTSHLP